MLKMQVCHDSSRMPDFGQKTWLWSNAQLRSEGMTPVLCATSVVCPTLVERRDSGHMPDSGRMPDSSWKAWLWSYAQLRSEDTTPVVCPTPVGRYDSSHISWLRSHFSTLVNVTTPIAHHDSGQRACRMSYLLICERLHLVELDDRRIL
jgi:hypothetical protein